MRTFISLKSCFFQICQLACYYVAITLLSMSKPKVLASCLIALAFALIGQQGRACSFNVTEVNFGSYDVFSNVALDSAGNIAVNCANGVGYTIAISAGSGSYSQRFMRSGTHTLNYNLYTTSNRAFVWGGTTSGASTVSGSGAGESVNHVIYGRIPPHQNVHGGNYSDTINLVINF